MSSTVPAFRGPGLQAALTQAHVPALMPALACLTGDLSALDAAWQPDLSDQAQRPQPQAGLSAQAQQAARERAQALIERWDAAGQPSPGALDPALLQRVIRFVTGDVDPAVVDLLLAANLTVAVIALLAAIAARTPLEMAVFPTFLLGATLVRLVLNIATTRLILTRAAVDGRLRLYPDPMATALREAAGSACGCNLAMSWPVASRACSMAVTASPEAPGWCLAQ